MKKRFIWPEKTLIGMGLLALVSVGLFVLYKIITQQAGYCRTFIKLDNWLGMSHLALTEGTLLAGLGLILVALSICIYRHRND